MNLRPAEYDLELHRRCDFSIGIRFLRDGQPVDLTGLSFKAELTTAYGTPAVEEFSIDNSNPTSGEITLSLTDAEITALTARTYYWDLLVTEGTFTTKALFGAATVKDTVSD